MSDTNSFIHSVEKVFNFMVAWHTIAEKAAIKYLALFISSGSMVKVTCFHHLKKVYVHRMMMKNAYSNIE